MKVDGTPFSFEDPGRIRDVLSAAGFRDINIKPHDQQVSCGDLEETLRVVTKVGALGKILREHPTLLANVEQPVRQALAACVGSDGVALKAATWIVTANA